MKTIKKFRGLRCYIWFILQAEGSLNENAVSKVTKVLEVTMQFFHLFSYLCSWGSTLYVLRKERMHVRLVGFINFGWSMGE